MVVDERSLAGLTDDEVDRVFRALADRTRRDILRRTLVGEVTVSQLASRYAMSFAAVQKHVAVLAGAGLVVKHPRGRERLVQADPTMLRRAQALLDQYEQLWRERVARLDALLAEDRLAEDRLAEDRLADDRLDLPLADDPPDPLHTDDPS